MLPTKTENPAHNQRATTLGKAARGRRRKRRRQTDAARPRAQPEDPDLPCPAAMRPRETVRRGPRTSPRLGGRPGAIRAAVCFAACLSRRQAGRLLVGLNDLSMSRVPPRFLVTIHCHDIL